MSLYVVISFYWLIEFSKPIIDGAVDLLLVGPLGVGLVSHGWRHCSVFLQNCWIVERWFLGYLCFFFFFPLLGENFLFWMSDWGYWVLNLVLILDWFHRILYKIIRKSLAQVLFVVTCLQSGAFFGWVLLLLCKRFNMHPFKHFDWNVVSIFCSEMALVVKTRFSIL